MPSRAPLPLLAVLALAACRAAPEGPAPERTAPGPSPARSAPVAPSGGTQRPVPVSEPAHVYPWKGVSQAFAPRRRAARATLPAALAAAPRGGALAGDLERRLPGLHLDGVDSLRAFGRQLQALAGVNVVVEEAAEEVFQDQGGALHVDLDRSLTVAKALDLVTDLAGDGVAWAVRDGVLLISTPERVAGPPRTFVMDVSDLVTGVPSYPGREMFVAPSGGLAPPDEDLPEPAPVLREELLLDLIRNTVDPESWDREGNSITIRDGKLIVTHR